MSASAFGSSGTDTPDKAIDGKGNTHWLATKGMTSTGEQIFTVDLGADRSTTGVTFVTNYYQNSYPRKFDVLTAPHGSNTFVLRASGVVGGQTCTAAWNAVTAGRIRIVCRAANSNWWSISELTVK